MLGVLQQLQEHEAGAQQQQQQPAVGKVERYYWGGALPLRWSVATEVERYYGATWPTAAVLFADPRDA